MRKAHRGWVMPEGDACSMLRLVEERIRSSVIRVEHRDILIQLRDMIEGDLAPARSWRSLAARAPATGSHSG
jgi:hypothetical protein